MNVTSVKPPPPRLARKPAQKKRSRPPLLWLVVVCGMLCAFFIFLGIQITKLGDKIELNPLQPIHLPGSPGQKVLLVMGVDAPNRQIREQNEDSFEGTRTDTMMLVRIDANEKRVSMVSVPRDSKVYIAGNRGIDKINAAHALGGPDLAVQTVQDSFGIPVDNFIVINFRGVRELVDAMGGVDLYVEKPMRYTDRTAKLFIDFKPGMQHLTGEQAEAFLRFRHDQLGDIGRIRRQQQFITAVTKKLRDPAIVFRIPELVKIATQYVESDLSLNDMVTLAFFGREVDMNRVRSATLPGRPGGVSVSYWVIDPEAAQVVLDRLILGNTEPPIGSPVVDPSEPVRVGLFYDPALAEQLPDLEARLEEQHFQVVCKSPRRRTSTQIIEHSFRASDKRTDSLRTISKGLQNARLIFAPVGTTFESNACSSGEDYTLILGGESPVKR